MNSPDEHARADRFRPWREAWADALYGEVTDFRGAGFYRRPEGPAGHFATSAQGIPGVSEILAQAVLAYADRCEVEVIVDFACGRAELLKTVAQFDSGRTLVGVDVVDRPERLDQRIEWVRSPGGAGVPRLEFGGRRALVVAHEWLDVVPCTLAEVVIAGSGNVSLREVLVAPDGEESLGCEIPADEQAWANTWWPTSAVSERLEIGLSRDRAWHALLDEVARTAAPGSLVLGIDYAHTHDARPPFGSLTGFRDGSECTPVPDRTCDITAHVAVDSLGADHVATQRDVLLDLFDVERRGHLAPVPLELARTDPPAYLQRLAMRSALAAAVDPNGLGKFAWFVNEIV